MKTTIEIPDDLFRQAKVNAASRGSTLKAYLTEALERKLSEDNKPKEERPWMELFGCMSHLHEENIRIQKIIDEEFGQIEPEDRL